MKNHTAKLMMIALALLATSCGSQQAPDTAVSGEQARNCASAAPSSQVDAQGRPLCTE